MIGPGKAKEPEDQSLADARRALAQIVREAETEDWFAASRKAVVAYNDNARAERDGAWSDKVRGFRWRALARDTALVSGVPRKQLGDSVVSLANRSVDILGAVDFLVLGI
jgi:hypothetical protein